MIAMTLPAALGMGAVLTATAVGVSLVNRNKQKAAAQKEAEDVK